MSAPTIRMVAMTAEVNNGAHADEQAEQEAAHNPDTLPTQNDPSGTCPRCNHRSNFDFVGDLTLKDHHGSRGGRTADERVTGLRCQGCREGTAVIEVYIPGTGPYSVGKWIGISWWPKPGHLNDTTGVPTELAEAFEEGARCVGVEAPNAAVAMFRNALAQIVQNKGSEAAKSKRTLNDAVKQMADDRTLHDSFKEWADHVRTVGNAGAHQESYESITVEQAEELMELTKHLIDTLYVQPAKLKRAMPAKKRPKP